jgi:hypothetical protein
MFDETKLNPFARAIAQKLFAEFPEWECFVCLDSAAEAEPGALVVKIPNDYGDFLWIDTYDGEITVSFDHWHEHFSESDSFREVLDSIREVLEDKFVLHVKMFGGHWCGTYCEEPGIRPDLTGFNPDSTVYVRSWSTPPRVYNVSEILMSGLSPNANKVVIAKFLSERMHWSLTEARQALQKLIWGNPVSLTVSDYDAAEVTRKLLQSEVRLK